MRLHTQIELSQGSAALAELCLLGNKTQHSQVGYIGNSFGCLF